MIITGNCDHPIPTEPIHETVIRRTLELHKKSPGRKAFITAENENDFVTFEQISQYIITVSEWFVENGYKKGDVVLLAVNNNWRYLIFVLGAARAGMIVSAACSQFTSYEMRHQIEDSTAKLIVLDEYTHSVVMEATAGMPIKHFISFADNVPSPVIPFSKLLNRRIRHAPMPKLDLSTDLMWLPYSSGTTGKPKGVMITYQNFAVMVAAILHRFAEVNQASGLPIDYVNPFSLQLLPLYHVMGTFRTLITFLRGSTQIMFTKFDLELMAKLIEERSIMSVAMVPAIVIRLVSSPLFKKYDLSSLNMISLGSAPFPDGAVQKFKEVYPNIKFTQGYGMTEFTYACHMPTAQSHELSVGILLPWTSMKVKKENGELCKAGEMGELYIKGPQIMQGYWRREGIMEEMLDQDGFLKSGDIVYFNEKGETFICDRIKELIKVNARQVAPAELESILLEHADVEDACVFGVEDAKTGERPIAVVVAKKSALGRNPMKLGTDLMSYLNEKLARYKHVKKLLFVRKIARTATGKILRRNMKEAYLKSRKSRL